MRIRLVWRILASMLIVSVVPFAVLGYSLQKRLNADLQESARQELRLHLDNVQSEIDAFVDAHSAVLNTASNLPAFTGMDPVQMAAAVTVMQKANPDFAMVHVVDATGMNAARSDGGKPLDYKDRLWFQGPMKGDAIATQTLISKTTGKPAITIGVPIKQGGKTVGVLAGVLNLERVSAVVDNLKFGQTGHAWLVDNDNKAMAHPDKVKVEKQESLAEHEAVKAARDGDQSVLTVADGGTRWLTAQRVLPQGWVLVVQFGEAEALAGVQQANSLIYRIGGAVLILAVLLAVGVALSLTRPIKAMAAYVGRLADGDFTQGYALRRSDELGDMAVALTHMQSSLRSHIGAVQAATGEVAAAAMHLSDGASRTDQSREVIAEAFTRTLSDVETATGRQQESLQSTRQVVGQLVAAVDQIARSSTHQATEVGQASNVVEEVAGQANVVSEGIAKLAQAVEEAAAAAVGGHETVGGALSGIRSTKASVDTAGTTVRDLGQRSEAIGKIVEEISAIAAQTNLLALNAAIEAARAGEAGRGFAVVAEEVRKLADRSVRSAHEIGTILASVRDGVVLAVKAMDEGAVTAGEGASRANEAQAALNQILAAVQTSRDEARTIRSAVDALVQGHEHLGKTMQTLAAVTEENSAAAEEMAAGSETVNMTVQELDTLALQNFAAIQGVGGELNSISSGVEQIVEAVRRLESMSRTLADSSAAFKV
ncbi:MAG TPA: methyl-accepting chemotaxis protein [Symbiobacteriaceae bacterium]|nr:methyl-accepting chemotaxis protein [Symbiobacteriaceae bacterium]